jgi:hypothetical protein
MANDGGKPRRVFLMVPVVWKLHCIRDMYNCGLLKKVLITMICPQFFGLLIVVKTASSSMLPTMSSSFRLVVACWRLLAVGTPRYKKMFDTYQDPLEARAHSLIPHLKQGPTAWLCLHVVLYVTEYSLIGNIISSIVHIYSQLHNDYEIVTKDSTSQRTFLI